VKLEREMDFQFREGTMRLGPSDLSGKAQPTKMLMRKVTRQPVSWQAVVLF